MSAKPKPRISNAALAGAPGTNLAAAALRLLQPEPYPRLEYFDNDEANEKAFTADGWFKTGDRVVLGAEGNFYYKDRDKDALKVGGENVSAREVEDCVREVGGIGDVAVVGQQHDMLDQVAVAFVIRGPDAPASEEEHAQAILDHCAGKLADFKVPRAVYFRDVFPVATLDKVAKNKLRDLADELVESSS